MSMNHIQFQPGLSMPEFIQQFGTEMQCEAALFQARWPHGFRCPQCNHDKHCVLGNKGRKTFQCNACHHQTSIIAGTLFQGSNLPLTIWFLAIHLISQAKTGLSALALKRQQGIGYPSAWLMHHKLMQREDGYCLSGSVQIDDAYLGGERSRGKAEQDRKTKCRLWQRLPSIAKVKLRASVLPVVCTIQSRPVGVNPMSCQSFAGLIPCWAMSKPV